MSTLPQPRPLYIDTPGGSVFSFFHAPTAATGLGVLFVPPFGWDDVCSYRPRRHWAAHLADRGHAALRIDLPGAGDSAGGPRDPDRVEAWTAAVGAAARWLRENAGCSRIIAIGLGLGGLVAYRAAATGAPVDDLVIWGTAGRGKTLLREMRAFAQLKAAEFPEPGAAPPPAPPEGWLEVAGYAIAPETAAAIEATDLTALDLPDPAGRRVLLLDRDGLAVDKRLRARLEELPVELTVAAGPGWGDMTGDPQHARPPREAMTTVDRWLAEAPAAAPAGAPPVAAAGSDSLELTVDGAAVRETPVWIEQPYGRMFGILAEPAGAPAAALALVLVNAGAVRRIGPNRMWVELARRWAARGVTVLRVDIEGLGDSDGDESRYAETSELYDPALGRQAHAAIDELARRGAADKYAVGGLCAGASWSFHAALEDPRVRAAVMVNLWAFWWEDSLPAERDAGRSRKLLQANYWRRLLTGDLDRRRALRSLLWVLRTPFELRSRIAHRRRRGDQLDDALDRIRDAGTRLTLILSRGESMYDQLEREGRLAQMDRWPNFHLEQLPGRDHTFRALYLQEHVHGLIDRALGEELERVNGGAPAPTERAATADAG